MYCNCSTVSRNYSNGQAQSGELPAEFTGQILGACTNRFAVPVQIGPPCRYIPTCHAGPALRCGGHITLRPRPDFIIPKVCTDPGKGSRSNYL
jgi:hypothetical protein